MSSVQNMNNEREGVKKQTLQFLEEEERKRAAVRFERNSKDLLEKKYNVLKSHEFVNKLGVFLYEKFSFSEGDEARKIFDILFEQIDKNKYIDEIHDVIIDICKLCLQKYNIGLMKYLCPKLATALEKKGTPVIVSNELKEFLTQSICVFVRSSQWKDLDILASKVWKIRNRKFVTGKGESAVFEDIFSKIAVKDIIEKIAMLHKAGDKEQKVLAENCIRCLGEEAILFLLNRLVFSKSKQDRLHLIQLLTSIGEEIILPIRKFMEEDLPWYAIRNLIILIAESGNPEYYPIVEGYLVHPDHRVQQQVVGCIFKLGGIKLERRLIQALPVVDDDIKLKLVMQLGDYTNEEIANGLIDVINKRDSYSQKIREELVYKACISLRSHPYTKVVNVLQHLLRSKLEKQEEDSRICIAIRETINVLEPKIRHLLKGEKSELEMLSFSEIEQQTGGDVAEDIDDFVEEIDELLRAGKVEQASALMYKKIIDSARAKDFDSAEMLRDKLLEANPDALQDVIRAAEIIEEERATPTASVQTEIWSDLLDTFTDEEYEIFINATHVEYYDKDEKILSAGEIDPCLYFLTSGTVRLSCNFGQRETFLKRMQPGDVIGVRPFFTASVWTVNLTCQQKSKLHVLYRSAFEQLGEKHPGLEEKLLDYCKKKEVVRDLIKMSGRDRRDNARYPVKYAVNNILLDVYGEKEGRRNFKGEMIDISRGGMSFSIRISKKKSAQQLLGRQIVSELKLSENSTLKCFGMIVSVQHLHEIAKEFSVHVKFYKELEHNRVTELFSAARH